MENEVINTVKDGERVTSTYAEIYFDDDYCDYTKASTAGVHDILDPKTSHEEAIEWVSPSDLLIGILELKPPFTSKITRGKTHEGILGIANEVLAVKRAKFMKYLNNLIHENDSAWDNILKHEKAAVDKKVKDIYSKIFIDKSNIMTKEILIFYENSLEGLEKSLKIQVKQVLISTHASIVSKLNTDIKKKMEKERQVLEDILKKRYESEVVKMKKYYKLLLNNELRRNSELINRAIIDRNDALKAFYRQMDAENISSTMYIMCTERKKCRIKQFILENYQSIELKEKYEKMKEKQDIIDILKEREVQISDLNKEWEDKIKKILQLFLKFISFSLKLLPEQASFLLNFEKMVVLQLNEMQKMPYKGPSILIDDKHLQNTFKFEQVGVEKEECINDPFILVGDLSGTPPPKYGSRETLPDEAELPIVRLQRQFVYAKCHQYEEIKTLLEAERCKCMDGQTKVTVESIPSTISEPLEQDNESIKSDSSYEPLLLDDIHRLSDCPVKNCKDWMKWSTFPNLNSYLDFDDEKFERVQTILGNLPEKGVTPNFINAKELVYRELPFSATKEPYHTVETQYSSQEDLNVSDLECPCLDGYIPMKMGSTNRIKESPSKILLDNMTKRKHSLRRLLQQNPNLLKIFTDESFDFQY